MSWPSQGVFIFALLSVIPPLVALISGNARAIAQSALISVLAALLCRSTYLVPVAIVLLVVSLVLASQHLTSNNLRRAVPWIVRLLLAAPPVAIGVYGLWLWLAFNWSPPRMLERAFVERSTRQQVDRAMTEILNSKFPQGTAEAELKVALVGQGFEFTRS